MNKIPINREDAIALATRLLDRAFGPSIPQLEVVALVDTLILAAHTSTPRAIADAIRQGLSQH